MEQEKLKDWSEIVEEHYRGIYAFALQFTGRRADAEDVCQQTFLKAQQKVDTIRDQTKIRPWLYQIARNICIDRTRWYKRLVFKEAPDEHVGHQVADVFASRELKRAVQTLPRQQRAVFLLRVVHEFSTAETAETLSISAGTVKVHLARALKSLRKELQPIYNGSTNSETATASFNSGDKDL